MNLGPLELRPHEHIMFEAQEAAPWTTSDAPGLGILGWANSAHASPILEHADLPGRDLHLKPADPAAARRFGQMRERTDLALAQPRALRGGRVELKCWAFRRRDWESAIDVAVDDRIVHSVGRTEPAVTTTEAAIEWLTQECVLRVGGSTFVLVSGIALDAPVAGAFTLHGKTRAVDVEATGQTLHVSRVAPPKRRDTSEGATLALARGELHFVDRSNARVLADEYALHLDSVRDPQYLRAWDRYAQVEIERAISDVRQLGALQYVAADRQSDSVWRVTLKDPADAGRLDPGESYHAVSEIPKTLLAAGHSAAVLKKLGEEVRRLGTPALKLADRAQPVLDLEIERMPRDGRIPELTADGYLVLSRAADWDQLDRRSYARNQLGRHHGLSLALAGRRPPDARQPMGKLPEDLPREVQEVFKHGITAGQREALRAVYENPGVTVIQGPPGTGKSTVIAALHRLLTRVDGEDSRRSIVVCAPQHEAVDNVAGKIDVFGLPPYRFGGRDNKRGDLDSWIRAHATRIERRLGERQGNDPKLPERVEELQRTAARYRVAAEPTARTARLLAHLAEQGSRPARDGEAADQPLLSASLRRRLRQRADELESRLRGDLDDWRRRRGRTRRCAALLRSTSGSFADDGPRTAARARAALDSLGLLDEHSRSVLDRAIATTNAGTAPLDELASLRTTLLDRIERPSDLDSNAVRDAEATALAGEVVDELSGWLKANVDPVEAVLRRMLERIAHEPAALTEAVKAYSVALAATTQGVGSNRFRDLTEGDTLRTAIVDEAGRGKPIDVLIPLVAARDRQILVGDHRQLPQLLEPDIETAVSEQIGPEFAEALKQSLFERLFKTLEGTPRCVTLREQFRMHSELARFVSTTFYPVEERFESVRDDREFVHGLGGRYRDQIAVWLDVAPSKETGRSKLRVAEARSIAVEVQSLISEAPHLSFGVVSMYSAQVEEIKRQLGSLDVLHKEDKEWLLAEDERYVRGEDGQPIEVDGRNIERLAVGTVDAFQGREFDVVFVSLVRSNTRPTPRLRFGHVAMPNRLNVAMSRQRSLLVVCGDRQTFLDGDAAQWPDAAPLRSFDALCSRAGALPAGASR